MNTVTTFAKRQEARDFAKSVNSKVQDRKDTIAEGEDRWAVEYVTSDTPVNTQEVLTKLKGIAQRTDEVLEAVQEVAPEVAKLPVLSVPKRSKTVVNKSFVINKKGNQVPVLTKRKFASLQAA